MDQQIKPSNRNLTHFGVLDCISDFCDKPNDSWGHWKFKDNLTLLFEDYYEIDLERINSSAQMLDWLYQCLGRDPLGLYLAFGEIFDPQKNACSWGQEKEFNGSKLAQNHAALLKPKRKNIAPKVRFTVLQRDMFTCKACGASPEDGAKLQVDHIYPVSKGGTNDISNLQTLCSVCNIGKGDRV
jgi:rubredoxin